MEGRELLVLRHGKSSWDSDARSDLERPLAGRGKRDAPRIGGWMVSNGLIPDLIISSTAKRARQTSRRVAQAVGVSPDEVVSDERIYYGGTRDLLKILAECHGGIRRLMIVGHNPTLESLVGFLGGPATQAFQAEKFFPTCALAWFRMPEDWSRLAAGAGNLVDLIRPRTLEA